MAERAVLPSLSGVAAPLLTVETTYPENIESSSPFLPRKWNKCVPYVIDDVVTQCNGTTGLNLEMAFELPKLAHGVIDTCIHATFPAHTTAGGNGGVVQPNYVDWLGYAMEDFLRVMFGANLVYDTQAYDHYFDMRFAYDDERLDAVRQLVRGDQTLAVRTADFANGVDMYVDPFLPWNAALPQHLPIVCLSQKTRFIYKTIALANMINNPSQMTITPQGIYFFELRHRVVHLTGPEGANLVRMSEDPSGICYMIHQHVRQNSDDFASLVTNFQINARLSSITKPLMSLRWALVPTKLVNNTNRNDFFFFAATPVIGPIPPGMTPYAPIIQWGIIANSLIIQRTIPRNYNRLYKWYKYYISRPGEDIYFQNYSEYPRAVNAAMGYVDYTNLNNPMLQITTGVGGTGTDPDNPLVAQSLRLIVDALDYNFWFLKSGNWSRTFN